MHGYDGGIMEGWTTLSVIAGRTSRIKLGTIHLAQPFRAPAIAAKMAATLDALSGGRLIFFYDCGWQEAEVRAYGLDWPDEEERIARMDEGLDADRRALARRRAARLRRALLPDRERDLPPEAGPAPRPPIWLGEARTPAWLDTICRHADGWNSTPASPARLAEKLDRRRARPASAPGATSATLELSLEIQVLIAPTEDEARAIAAADRRAAAVASGAPRAPTWSRRCAAPIAAAARRPSTTGWSAHPRTSIEQMREYLDLGVSHFMLWFIDFPSLTGMRLFAERVAPALRGSR